jgi:hypothetical protein
MMDSAKSPGRSRQLRCQDEAHPSSSHITRFEKTIVVVRTEVMSLMAEVKVYISTTNHTRVLGSRRGWTGARQI